MAFHEPRQEERRGPELFGLGPAQAEIAWMATQSAAGSFRASATRAWLDDLSVQLKPLPKAASGP